MNVAEALREATDELARAGVENASVDAAWLVASVTGLSRSQLALDGETELAARDQQMLRSLVARRAEREPLAYVLGEWGFRGLTLKVDKRALVPRPETEVTVERCLALLQRLPRPDVLDVGTGSGAIALAIADEHPGARVTALDRSAEALALARENVERAGLGARVTLVLGDLADGLRGSFDLVVSNPPYVLDEELDALAPEVGEWEPREALVDRGQTVDVARGARGVLRPGGHLVLETHWQGAARTAELLRELGYLDVAASKDLTGRQRVVEGRWA